MRDRYNLETWCKSSVILLGLLLTACGGGGSNIAIPKTEAFAPSLSSYNIFQGEMRQLQPAAGYELYQISSQLFTDHAVKQRLIKIPEGSQVSQSSTGELVFPEGTILVKTFYYPNNAENVLTVDSQIVETRLLVKAQNQWNVATYVWNQQQTEAMLDNSGAGVTVNAKVNGVTKRINYQVPNEGDCATCHQRKGAVAPIGPTVLNLNRDVIRNGEQMPQLDYLAQTGIFTAIDPLTAPNMVDYNNTAAPLAQRGRAYLAMNCAHCHNPEGWGKPASKGMDLRYQTAFSQSGIGNKKNKILGELRSGGMPYIGTTVIHNEGVNLINEYVSSL